MEGNWESAEAAVAQVSERLRKHRLWDLVLLLFPPLVVFLYAPLFLSRTGDVGQKSVAIWAACLLGAVFIGFCVRYLRGRPPAPHVARLIDRQVAGRERFLTLVTADPARQPAALHQRLRAESRQLLDQFHIKLEFPYRLKKSFWGSVMGSLVIFLLFHLLVLFYFRGTPASTVEQLKLVAEELARDPRFAPLGKDLESLLQQLQAPGLTPEQKQSLVAQMRQQVAEQMAGSKKEDGATKDSLQQADKALQGLEKGEQPGREKGETGGGIGSNLQQKGEGEGKESKGSGGAGKGETAVIAQQERQDGKPTKPTKGEEKGPSERGQGPGESAKQDPNNKGENEGAKRGETEGKSGKTKTQEGEMSPSGPPPERYRQAGEQGEKGLRGVGYVTVELPEAEVSSTGGRGEAVKAPRQNFPVSNVPLPPGSGPEGVREKQPVPLEYRGLIR